MLAPFSSVMPSAQLASGQRLDRPSSTPLQDARSPLAFAAPIGLPVSGRLNQRAIPHCVTSLRAAHDPTDNAPRNDPLNNDRLNNKWLIPAEKVLGLEALRPLEDVAPTRKSNPFSRLAIPGLSVSRRWESRVHNLRSKGPFPTNQQQIGIRLASGKTLNALITYPTQKELGSEKDFPLVVYSPPGFVGELKFPAFSFFDAQLGLPMMEHFASYGMVSVTLLEPSSVLLDGVENVNHQQQADELNEIIDLLLAPEGTLHQNGLPQVDSSRAAVVSYSRGAKVALLAASDRLRQQREAASEAEAQPIKFVSIAKDPVNLGGVPAAVVEQVPPCAQELIPETYESWKESSHRYPVAPLPDASTDSHFPIEEVTDPVLMFSAKFNWINSDPRYAAQVFFDALPEQKNSENLLVEVKGTHESWVDDYDLKGDSMALMTAFLLTHLGERERFREFLGTEEILKIGKTFEKVTRAQSRPPSKDTHNQSGANTNSNQ